MYPPSQDPAALWAEAQMAALNVKKWPPYGSAEWLRMEPTDPRRAAAVVEALELHRRSAAYRAWLNTLDDGDWYAEVFGDARAQAARLCKELGRMRTYRELRDERAKPGPVHQLKATAGWPPVAIPGRPGWYRRLIDGRQVDLPHNESQEKSA